MEYKRIDNVIIARIDRGEEILKAISLIARAEDIKLANINALGALSEFTVGVYNVEKQQYFKNDFSGAYEIVSLTGSINTMDGKYYSHLHLCAADEKGQAFGGHLNRAVVSATCEMFIYLLDGTVDRFRDPLTGLNLFKF